MPRIVPAKPASLCEVVQSLHLDLVEIEKSLKLLVNGPVAG